MDGDSKRLERLRAGKRRDGFKLNTYIYIYIYRYRDRYRYLTLIIYIYLFIETV